ncbi:MAG TPA: hypothetical protein VD859_01285, partial [Nocardioides sp.]|nr:hypothetical protein [Nocardioides sp.]
MTAKQLRSARYRRLHTGIYIANDVVVTPLVAAQAALVPFGPGAWASHATAARYWTPTGSRAAAMTCAGRKQG